MNNMNDIQIGDKFGLWTVIADGESEKTGAKRWLCQCGCEKHTIRLVRASNVNNLTR